MTNSNSVDQKTQNWIQVKDVNDPPKNLHQKTKQRNPLPQNQDLLTLLHPNELYVTIQANLITRYLKEAMEVSCANHLCRQWIPCSLTVLVEVKSLSTSHEAVVNQKNQSAVRNCSTRKNHWLVVRVILILQRLLNVKNISMKWSSKVAVRNPRYKESLKTNLPDFTITLTMLRKLLQLMVASKCRLKSWIHLLAVR